MSNDCPLVDTPILDTIRQLLSVGVFKYWDSDAQPIRGCGFDYEGVVDMSTATEFYGHFDLPHNVSVVISVPASLWRTVDVLIHNTNRSDDDCESERFEI